MKTFGEFLLSFTKRCSHILLTLRMKVKVMLKLHTQTYTPPHISVNFLYFKNEYKVEKNPILIKFHTKYQRILKVFIECAT